MSHKYRIYNNENKIVSSGCNIRRRKETPFTIKTLAGQLYEMVAEPCDTVGTLKEFIYEYTSELITGTIKTKSFRLFIIPIGNKDYKILEDNNVNLISILGRLEDPIIYIWMGCNEFLYKKIDIYEEQSYKNKSNSICVLGDFIYKICVNKNSQPGGLYTHNIFKINRNDGTSILFAECEKPYGICTDGTNFYVTDKHKIRVLNEFGREVETFDIPQIDLALPAGICVSGDEIYVLNVSSYPVGQVDDPIMVFNKNTGELIRQFGGSFHPISICVSENNIYVSSDDYVLQDSHQIRIYDKNGTHLFSIKNVEASSICFSTNNQELYIADKENDSIKVYRKEEEDYIFNRQFGSSNKKGVFKKKGFFHRYTGYILQYNEDDLDRPYSICLSPDEKELYVADRTKQIKVYKTSC